MLKKTFIDQDAIETGEWLEAFEALAQEGGGERARFVLDLIQEKARLIGVATNNLPYSAYRNTIPLPQQPKFPGNLEMEERITSIIRWNALAMVVRANKAYGELGGHIASYASAAEIFEMGFNHFFRGRTETFDGDLVYFQPHSAPGVYARAFLEGRLSEVDISSYRQEFPGKGLCSYPHPWLMNEFWQLPTGSMGIGPLSAVYQARYMRYLQARGLADTQERHVWGVFGDGEMDEPESIAGLTLAAREGLENLTFIVNCNLQRLDGPVRGNGQIIQELEALFVGAGWNVIKVLWGSEWDSIFARDTNNVLLRRFAETVDGEYQNLGSKEGDYNRSKFFDVDPESAALVSHLSDDEIHKLKRGGHDFKKLYAAFATAKAHKGRPTVILTKTKKGYGMGGSGESRMMAHQAKKLDVDALLAFRDRFNLPLTDKQVEALEFYKPPEDSPELRYLQARRADLGGYLPRRFPNAATSAPKRPELAKYAKFALAADGKEMSTTMAAVRMLGGLLKDKEFGPRLVPIVADEARTFGMDNLFRQVGIYAPEGQLYEPEDSGSMMYYKESTDGQLLEEGITEAGALSSWTAAATSYSLHNTEMLPVYIYYSMFGFQRVGDLIWAAADQRARGFLLGATAGRTTLSGEGLQHQDGSSHMMAASIPNCRAYDPAFAYELAVIMEYGMGRMLDEKRDEFFYITVMNENYAQPSLPEGVKDGIIRGMYKFVSRGKTKAPHVRLVGSGTIMMEVLAAAEILEKDYGIASDIYSATSFTELAREAALVQRQNRLGAVKNPAKSHVETLLSGTDAVIAASDYVRAFPQQIAPYIDATMTVLGTDGFGRSANRKSLRRFFEVDRQHIALAAIESLVRQGKLDHSFIGKAISELEVDVEAAASWTV
ncbi:alpha-ketoglutarate dehydrogenase [Paracoccus saliphilus]|uniref:Pyruvate dehydrogenase E1 component n=1 Tax=Paracoccus saliphilus TaxID=405559 RepID=A0AA46A4T1_9RHOB|nr:alpha-ketoglutarate dehydrogenase [Paracoccus saliphilus]WCR01453.1 alpha-ketoglutarate dehydrogenase [Paracoccus saliphilus]SIS69252.1 pyruvate dehydrogenase E1 component [Paracoccus saliphilus]